MDFLQKSRDWHRPYSPNSRPRRLKAVIETDLLHHR
jgi:hypothetical protein